MLEGLLCAVQQFRSERRALRKVGLGAASCDMLLLTLPCGGVHAPGFGPQVLLHTVGAAVRSIDCVHE